MYKENATAKTMLLEINAINASVDITNFLIVYVSLGFKLYINAIIFHWNEISVPIQTLRFFQC